MRNTTKVVLTPEKAFALIEEKDKAPRNRNLILKKVRKISEKRDIVLMRLSVRDPRDTPQGREKI